MDWEEQFLHNVQRTFTSLLAHTFTDHLQSSYASEVTTIIYYYSQKAETTDNFQTQVDPTIRAKLEIRL